MLFVMGARQRVRGRPSVVCVWAVESERILVLGDERFGLCFCFCFCSCLALVAHDDGVVDCPSDCVIVFGELAVCRPFRHFGRVFDAHTRRVSSLAVLLGGHRDSLIFRASFFFPVMDPCCRLLRWDCVASCLLLSAGLDRVLSLSDVVFCRLLIGLLGFLMSVFFLEVDCHDRWVVP